MTKCAKCPFEGNEFQFCYMDTRTMEPLCMTCFIGEVEGRIKKVEQTLHKKSCILYGGKELMNNLFSIMSAPTKLICRSCVTILVMAVDKEARSANLY